MNNIIEIAAKFNQQHGRAMTYEQARMIILRSTCNPNTNEMIELYAESVKQFERTKVIEEVLSLMKLNMPEDYLLRELKSLKSLA